MKVNIIFVICGLSLLFACKQKPKLDSPTQGNIPIVIDENYFPIIDSGLEVFHSIYIQAKITPEYLPEADAFRRFINDSVEVIIAPRKLSSEEEKYLEGIKIVPKVTEIARDAVAIIVHPSQGETNFSLDQLSQILSGKISNWAELGKTAGTIQVVFDNKNSSSVRYAIDSLTKGTPMPSNIFAAQNSEEVIKYVSDHVGAIGIIGVNWVSDMDDPKSQKFVKSVEVAAISKMADSEAFEPYQAYIATRDYPLTRSLYIISRQGRNGLGTGFASFMASDRGQRIVLKSGLVPATMPVRLVEVKDAMPQ